MKPILLFLGSMGLTIALVVVLLWQFGAQTKKPIVGIAGTSNHTKGQGSIELVEFSDFQCPACLAVQEPLNQLLKKYEGRVHLVFRHFPLTNIHKNAQLAASASEAAGQQGKFWEFHDELFAQQGLWEKEKNPTEYFGKMAEELSLDKNKFLVDLESEVVKNLVATDAVDATRFGLSGTPTFFLNGIETDFGELETRIIELNQ